MRPGFFALFPPQELGAIQLQAEMPAGTEELNLGQGKARARRRCDSAPSGVAEAAGTLVESLGSGGVASSGFARGHAASLLRERGCRSCKPSHEKGPARLLPSTGVAEVPDALPRPAFFLKREVSQGMQIAAARSLRVTLQPVGKLSKIAHALPGPFPIQTQRIKVQSRYAGPVGAQYVNVEHVADIQGLLGAKTQVGQGCLKDPWVRLLGSQDRKSVV